MSLQSPLLPSPWAKPPFGSRVDFRDPITQGLAAEYVLNEGGGLRAYNYARSNAIAGVINSSSGNPWSESRTGDPCLIGNGNTSTRYVDVGLSAKPSALNLNGSYTILCLINSTLSGSQCIFVDSNSSASLIQVGVRLLSTGFVSISWGADVNVLNSSGKVTANTWTVIGLTNAGTTGAWTPKTWINGLLDNSNTTSTNPSAQQGAAIGRFGNLASQYFAGLIEYVKIWNRVLTPGEIFRIYRSPYSYWRFPPWSARRFGSARANTIFSRRGLGSRVGHRQAGAMAGGL
jgi:hypothetical protein